MKKFIYQLFKQFRLILFLLFIVFIAVDLTGQRNLKYKDVFKVIEEKSKEESYSLLLVYQKQDPFFPNTYLQLGLLAQFWSKDYDALTNLKDVEFFIYNTNLYYGLALSKIDQKEVRKNDKFYLNIDRFKGREKIESDEIRSFIQEQIDANNEYSKNVQLVTRLFNSSILHYNNCIRIFKEINTNNNKIKDIYLTANAKFMADLKELETSFDSTIYYLQNYQTALKNYPIKNYNQKYKLLPIETYRLHGLTGSDFLNDEIPIWNYGAWAKSVRQVLITDIEEMRNLINKADQKLNENISLLADAREYRTDYLKQKVDEKLKFKIGKYDHQSLLLELFRFKENKIEFLAAVRDPLNNPKDTSVIALVQKSRYFDELIKRKALCDSTNNALEQAINQYDINKYGDFFANNYGGAVGLKNYLKNESVFLNSKLKSSFTNFRDYLVEKYNSKLQIDTLLFIKAPVILNKSTIEFNQVKLDTFYTVDFKINGAGDYYITGFIKPTGNVATPFIAKSNGRKDIKWLKTIPSITSNSSGILVHPKDDGCELIVRSFLDTLNQNQIYIFDNEGKQKDKIDLKVNSFPRFFGFDEINQKYLMVFKGAKQDPYDCLSDELSIIQYDAVQKVEKWSKKLNVHGNFIDIFNLNENTIAVFNFSAYSSENITVKSGAGENPVETNAIVVIFDADGKIIQEIPFFNESAYFVTNALKINSNTISLVGFRSPLFNPNESTKKSFGELVYLLLNSNGELQFDNSKP